MKKSLINWWLSGGVSQILEIDIPSYFSDRGFTAKIYDTGTSATTNYDWNVIPALVSGNECFIHPALGSDANPGTIELPFQNFDYALTQNFNIYNLSNEAVFKYANGTKGISIQKPCLIRAYGSGGRVTLTNESATPTWVNHSGNVWYADNPDAIPIGGITDNSNIDVNGRPSGLFMHGSIAAVQAGTDRYFYDSGANRVYVHLFNGRQPDSNVKIYLSALQINAANTNTHALYITGVNIWGGGVSILNGSGTAPKPFGMNDCDISYYVGQGGVNDKNAFFIGGNVRGYVKDTTSYYCSSDMFNYNSSDPGVMLEWNCRSNFGRASVSTPPDSNNGSTNHADFRVIRVLGNHQGTSGRPVADIGTTKNLNIYVTSGNSLRSDSFSAGFSASPGTENWYYKCTWLGGGIAGLQSLGTPLTMHVYDGGVGNLQTSTQDIFAGTTLNYLTESQVYVAGAGVPGSYDARTNAYITRLQSLNYNIPNSTRLTALQNFFTNVGNTILNKTDYLYLGAWRDVQLQNASLVNLVDVNDALSTYEGSFVYGTRGLVTNGTNAFLDTKFNPTVHGTNYVLNSACRLIILEAVTANAVLDGLITTASANRMISSNVNSQRINSGVTNLNAVADLTGIGLKAISRSTASDVTLSNGTTESVRTQTSSTLPNESITVGKSATAFGALQCGLYVLAGNLTKAERESYLTAYNTLKTEIGFLS